MQTLKDVVSLTETKLLSTTETTLQASITAAAPVLIVLAAGKGTRFGTDPKCIQLVNGTPLARHAIDEFRQISTSPSVCIVGYRHQEVSGALGCDNIFVRTDNPAGGTAHAAYEAFCVPELLAKNPLVIVTMGDRVVPSAIFSQLWQVHIGADCGQRDSKEADLTLLTAQYDPPRNKGKGRILRDRNGQITGIREQKDIENEADAQIRQRQLDLTEGNCPLYIIRARILHNLLSGLTNDNAQGQFYITDIVARLAEQGALIRSITTTPADDAYSLLCADVTRSEDLLRLEHISTEYWQRK